MKFWQPCRNVSAKTPQLFLTNFFKKNDWRKFLKLLSSHVVPSGKKKADSPTSTPRISFSRPNYLTILHSFSMKIFVIHKHFRAKVPETFLDKMKSFLFIYSMKNFDSAINLEMKCYPNRGQFSSKENYSETLDIVNVRKRNAIKSSKLEKISITIFS